MNMRDGSCRRHVPSPRSQTNVGLAWGVPACVPDVVGGSYVIVEFVVVQATRQVETEAVDEQTGGVGPQLPAYERYV